MASNPTEKPTRGVMKLTKPSRSGTYTFAATWVVPPEHTKNDNKQKAEHLDIWWVVGLSGKRTITSKRNNRLVTAKQSTLDISSLYASSKTYTRQSFWPYTKTKLTGATVKVRETNKHGVAGWVSAGVKLYAPSSPTVQQLTLNATNGRVTASIKSSSGGGNRERARTAYRFSVYRSATKRTTRGSIRHSTSTDFTDWIDIVDWQTVSGSNYIRVTVEAWNEGWSGNSAHVEKHISLSYPAKATITDISCAGTKDDSKVTVKVQLADTNYHPVTLARLEALVDTEYARSTDIPGTAEWEQVGATDDGGLRAFAAKVGQLRPQQGNYTWLRVVTVNKTEEPYSVYSAYKRVRELEVSLPSAVDDKVFLSEPIPSDDGDSAEVTVMWREDTPNTGTELTWSSDDRAWKSTQPPESYEFDWESSGTPPTGYTGYATIMLMGLTEGVRTFIRARRYYESPTTGDRTWTRYSNKVDVMPVTSPNTVTLSLPPAVARGDDIEAVWTYDTEATQTEWQLFEVLGNAPNIQYDMVLDSGKDARGSVVLSSDRLSHDTASVYVSMSTGGAAVQSDPVTISIVDPPICSVTVGTLTAKPLVVGVESTAQGAVTLVVAADGISGDGFGPDQMEGDTVWSGVVQAQDWTATQDGYETSITVPEGESLFYDTGSYHVTASVTDSATGLASNSVEASFTVDYTHKAPELTDDEGYLAEVGVVPSDVTDSDGTRTIGCTVLLDAPSGFAETDLIDVYRVGRDGQQMVADSVTPESTVFDPYAPFGGDGLAYRIVTRTVDGDRAWTDVPYELGTQGPTDRRWMRIDFGGEYVECERGVAPSDGWSKDFSLMTGMDGTMTGSWNSGVKRTSSSRATFVRAYEESQQRAMERLAEYVGPCYVRVSDGSAYEADVQVTGRSTALDSAGVVYSLSMTRLDASGEYSGVVS